VQCRSVLTQEAGLLLSILIALPLHMDELGRQRRCHVFRHTMLETGRHTQGGWRP
jgi:hypothetical protein